MRELGHVVSVEKLKRHVKGVSIPRAIHGLGLRKKLFFFISGIIVSIPFTVYTKTLINHLRVMMPILYPRIYSTAIFTPFLEEFAKAYPLLYRREDNERSIFTLGLLVGFGFGIAELLIYVLRFNVPVCIRLTGVLFHAANTSITAYGIAKKRPWPYLISVILHILNNLSAIYDLSFIMAGYPILIATSSIAWYLHRKASPMSFINSRAFKGDVKTEFN